MTNEEALAELERLVKAGGVLSIITDEHACCGGVDNYIRVLVREPGRPEQVYWGPKPEVCGAFEHSVKDPRHFVCHEVGAIEEMAGEGEQGKRYRAVAKGGENVAWTMGYPLDLLKRLTELHRAVTASGAVQG